MAKNKKDLRNEILSGNTRAVVELQDRLRARGGDYAEFLEVIRSMFREAGRDEPDDATIDGWVRLGEE